MCMIRAYEGYFEDGKFVAEELGLIKIPEKTKVVMNIFDDVKINRLSENGEAWLTFVEEIRNCDEEISSDYDDVINERISFGREMGI